MVDSGKRKQGEEEPPPMVQVARYSGLGLQLAGSVVLFMLGGSWVDRRIGTEPLLTIIGALGGGALGFYSLYRSLMKARDEDAGKR
jgi:F0F1-type ATP synthase assembly protein I